MYSYFIFNQFVFLLLFFSLYRIPLVWSQLILVGQSLVSKFVFLGDRKDDSKFIPVQHRCVIFRILQRKFRVYFRILLKGGGGGGGGANSTYSVSSLSQKQDYNIIHKHFNDIHIVIELSVIYFSMYFTYQLSEQKFFFLAQRGSDK